MINAIRRNKLFIIILGLILIALVITLTFIFLNKSSTKPPLRGVFVNEANFLESAKEGVGI